MEPDLTEPFLNARFRVEIEGLPGRGAVEVIFPEGRILRRKGKSRVLQYGPLILRRGLTAAPDWYRWWDAARRSDRVVKKQVVVVLMDRDRRDLHRWTFSGVVPVAYAVSPLHALHSELLFETLEMAVHDFTIASGR
jgi:phage tail-like protein